MLSLRQGTRGVSLTPKGHPAHARRGCARSSAPRRVVPHASATGPNNSKNFSTWLLKEVSSGQIDADLAAVLQAISTASKEISCLVRSAPIDGMTGVAASSNASGDEQKPLDILANEIFCAAVSESGRTGIVVSEEEDAPIAVENTDSGDYIVCFDPIDGSSNIDACVTTGSIFAVYSKGECDVDWDDDSEEEIVDKCLTNVRRSGNELVAAGYCMYSSSTVLMLSVGNGVYGFTLDVGRTGEFVLSHPNLKIPEPGSGGQRIYSGNNANVNLWAPELKEYVEQLQDPDLNGGKPYSYRYIGALVGDFHRTLLYGGIWLYPGDVKAPQGKARLLYEVAPMGMLAEQAGGMATWGEKAQDRVLDVVPESVHQRSPLFVGSSGEVQRLQEFLATK